MEVRLREIAQSPSLFKVCEGCRSLNHIANAECVQCEDNNFTSHIAGTVYWIKQEYERLWNEQEVDWREADKQVYQV
jgi:RNA polymerase subunit RPABC4/transcription elongation factor Spt4